MRVNVRKARDFALERHGEQKYGELPYVYHLDMVYEIVLAAGLDEDYLMASYLHDILEDTNTTKEELATKFNPRVAEMVDSVSGFGNSRKEKKACMIAKLNKFPEGINLKMADRYANMKESLSIPGMFDMYVKELEQYMPLFEKGSSLLLAQINSLVQPKKLKLN